MLVLAATQGTAGLGVPAEWLSTAAALVREVPAFELGLAWDLDRVTSTVRDIVDRVAVGKT